MSRPATKLCSLLPAVAMAAGLSACDLSNVQGSNHGWLAASHGPPQPAQARPTAHTVRYITLALPYEIDQRLEIFATMTRTGPDRWVVVSNVFGRVEEEMQSQVVSEHVLRFTGREGTSLLDLEARTLTGPTGVLEIMHAR